ncbi:Uncharacterized protein Fot_20365 [Forsythia ovata]|uniref:Uncharacterized protein n=1 Tax=Forsythia ovata TaxID=205694 RepID=A0ABD1VNQ1_9LAMI
MDIGHEGVEPTFSGGTISTSQASTAGVVNQVSSNIGEPSSVEIGRSCGAPLLYSQPTAASGGLNVQEPQFYSQHGSSTPPNLPKPKAKPMRKEEKVNGLSKARAVLTMYRKKNPHNFELWLAAIRVESRHGYKKEADILMANALNEWPSCGILWAASIEMVPRPQKKTKSRDAYKRCDHDPYVIVAVAKLFWHERKVDKARTFINYYLLSKNQTADGYL